MNGLWRRIKTRMVWTRLFLSLLALPVSAGWTGDSLLDVVRIITEWPIGKPWYDPSAWYSWGTSAQLFSMPPEAHVRFAGAVGGLVMFTNALLFIYHNRSRLLSTDATNMKPAASASRSVLILGLSPLRGSNAVAKACAALQSLPMQDIAASKADIDKLIDKAQANGDAARVQNLTAVNGIIWQQPFRMVWSHLTAANRREPFRAILVVTSKKGTEDGSESQVNDFMTLLEDRLKDFYHTNRISAPLPLIRNVTPGGIDFEEYTEVVNALNQAVSMAEQDLAVPHDRICVDITAGLKIFSVAAAMVTMNRKLIFGYVTTQGIPRFYDARINIGAALGEG